MNLVVPASDPFPYGPPIHIIDVSPIRSSVSSRREQVSRARRRIAAAVVVGAIALVGVAAIAVMPF